MFKRFNGNICVSNPRYDLYVDPGQVAFGQVSEDDTMKNMRYLMELIPSLHTPVSLRVLAESTELTEEDVFNLFSKMGRKGSY